MNQILRNLFNKKIEVEKNKARLNNRFSLFHAKFSDELFDYIDSVKDFYDFYQIIKINDKLCNISYEEGMKIDKISNTSKTFLHRTNLSIDKSDMGVPNNEDLNSIMSNGLKNYGHMNAGGGGAFINYFPPLSLTMSSFKGITGYINLLSPYKENDTVVFASFPNDLVDDDGRPTRDYSDIYDLSGDIPSIKPEFMKGALVRKDDGMWHYYSKEEILTNMQSKKKN